MYINTNDKSCYRYRIQKNLEWVSLVKNRFVPYDDYEEDERAIVRYVQNGIHPFLNINIGPARCRSAFDYLNERGINELIILIRTLRKY